MTYVRSKHNVISFYRFCFASIRVCAHLRTRAPACAAAVRPLLPRRLLRTRPRPPATPRRRPCRRRVVVRDARGVRVCVNIQQRKTRPINSVTPPLTPLPPLHTPKKDTAPPCMTYMNDLLHTHTYVPAVVVLLGRGDGRLQAHPARAPMPCRAPVPAHELPRVPLLAREVTHPCWLPLALLVELCVWEGEGRLEEGE